MCIIVDMSRRVLREGGVCPRVNDDVDSFLSEVKSAFRGPKKREKERENREQERKKRFDFEIEEREEVCPGENAGS